MSGIEKYWYNFATGRVERGFESPTIDRAGPFDTEEEAARAPEILRERSRAWADEDAHEDEWGARPSNTDDGASGQ